MDRRAIVGNSSATADPEEADEGGREPDDGGEEGEGDVGLVASTVVAAGADVAPVENGAAAITNELKGFCQCFHVVGGARGTTYVDEQTKGDKPEDADEDVHGPVDKAAREGQQPDEREHHRDAGHHDGVDEAAVVPRGGVVVGVEVRAGDTGHDGGEGQLRGAKDHLHNAVDRHFGGSFLSCLRKEVKLVGRDVVAVAEGSVC